MKTSVNSYHIFSLILKIIHSDTCKYWFVKTKKWKMLIFVYFFVNLHLSLFLIEIALYCYENCQSPTSSLISWAVMILMTSFAGLPSLDP